MDLTESAEADFARIESIVIPLIIVALIILMRNWRYVPISFTPILLTIVGYLVIVEILNITILRLKIGLKN